VAAVRRNAEKTTARIIRAARRLFAECDIASVGIRDIASAYVNASLFAFGAMSPWLIAAVGLDPEDF